jgi:hypothetical protein
MVTVSLIHTKIDAFQFYKFLTLISEGCKTKWPDWPFNVAVNSSSITFKNDEDAVAFKLKFCIHD